MAALKIKDDSTGKLIMQSPLLPSWGNLLSTLVWLAIFAFFFLPSLAEGNVNWENLAFIVFILVVTVGGSVLSSLLSTQVVVDRTTRGITTTRRLFGFPIQSSAIPFRDVANIEYQHYRQSSGRTVHDAWRVNAILKDGGRVPLNWDGQEEEMSALAKTLTERTGAELLDNSAKPAPMIQQMFDTLRGERDESEPEPETEMPAAPRPAPWQMPASETAQTDLAPLEPVSAPSARHLPIADLEKRVAADPMDAEARYALARKHHARGQLDRAIELYRETLRIDTANSEAQNDLGVALQQRGKRTEAEAAYRRAVALDPFSSTAHLNLGMMLRAMNRASDASQEFYQARQNARGDAQSRAAEAASTGAKMEPQLSKT
ncbi:MAG: tetratricopeptide repeat protein [Chloroflexi bacterium]|nr:tetratricopeptide repeat protein [Chloroflexota bacterium]